MSIFLEQRPSSPTRSVPVCCAVLLHAGVIAFLARVPSSYMAPMRLPGSALGTHLSLTYAPGRPAQQAILAKATVHQVKQVAPASAVSLAPPPRPEVSSKASPAAATSPTPADGNDALGTGNVNIALAITFPTPRPDLTALPRGTVGDVVVDIVIDEQGRVARVTMNRGLGHGVDETVLATVQQWSFHPATRDGKAVASEQELHFHYERT